MSEAETPAVDNTDDEAATAPPAALALENVVRRYDQAGSVLEVLTGASMSLNQGEIVALVGPSGAGKSTLLHIAGLLERPDEGTIMVGGENCSEMSDLQRTRTRLSRIGFVYQYHHLLPEFSALENVMIPQMIGGLARGEAKKRSKELLAMVGLSDRESHRPARLSGGEQQRVAIARALANAPDVLLADEPTGNLDHNTTEIVFELMVRLVRGVGLAALIATHNLDIAARMDRVLILKDGLVEQA